MLLMFYTLHHLLANPHLKMIKLYVVLYVVLLMNFLPFAFKVKLFNVAFELLTTRCCTSRHVKSILASKPSAFYVLKYVYIIVCTMLRNCYNMLRNCFIILDIYQNWGTGCSVPKISILRATSLLVSHRSFN